MIGIGRTVETSSSFFVRFLSFLSIMRLQSVGVLSLAAHSATASFSRTLFLSLSSLSLSRSRSHSHCHTPLPSISLTVFPFFNAAARSLVRLAFSGRWTRDNCVGRREGENEADGKKGNLVGKPSKATHDRVTKTEKKRMGDLQVVAYVLGVCALLRVCGGSR
jgi:hypothetical protein